MRVSVVPNLFPTFPFCYDPSRDSQPSQFISELLCHLHWINLWFSHFDIYFIFPFSVNWWVSWFCLKPEYSNHSYFCDVDGSLNICYFHFEYFVIFYFVLGVHSLSHFISSLNFYIYLYNGHLYRKKFLCHGVFLQILCEYEILLYM